MSPWWLDEDSLPVVDVRYSKIARPSNSQLEMLSRAIDVQLTFCIDDSMPNTSGGSVEITI